MKSFKFSIAYFALSAICVWVMYVSPANDLIAVFIVALTAVYSFVRGFDHLNRYMNEHDSN